MTLLLQDLIEYNLSHHMFFLHFFKECNQSLFFYSVNSYSVYTGILMFYVYINFIKIHVSKKKNLSEIENAL